MRSLIILAFLIPVVAVRPSIAQDTPAAAAPAFSLDEMESLLLKGRIADRKSAPRGVTDAYRVTLSDGQRTHDAQVQNVDIFRDRFEVTPKYTEFNFRDTYRYNIAAYRLSRLIGLDNVPMSVPRLVDAKQAAVTWWIDDVAMSESARLKLSQRDRLGPNPSRTNAYVHILRVFDELIQNRDRNSGNLLWTADWKMWMIDHTRAFRLGKDLLKPEQLQRVDRTLLEKIRALNASDVTHAMDTSLTKAEIDAMLARRDAIVRLFDEKIAQRGEAAVLFTLANQ